MNIKQLGIVNIILIFFMIIIIAGSSYGLGKNDFDKASPNYQAAAVFLTISVILVIVSIASLIGIVLYSSGAVTARFNVPSTSIPVLN